MARDFGAKPSEVPQVMEQEMIGYVGKLSQSVEQIINGTGDTGAEKAYDAVAAFYPTGALPSLLRIVRESTVIKKVEQSLETIRYILEVTGGVIPPELGISTGEVKSIVKAVQEKRSEDSFEKSRKIGGEIIELTEQLDTINGGGF